jgi:peroxiredoxin
VPLSDRLVGKVSVAASIGLAVTLLGSVGVVAWPRVASALGIRPAAAAPAPAYVAGDRIDVPASWYASAPRTLVIFARANCGACLTAQHFLKTLVADVRARGAAVVVAGHRETPEADAEFTESLGLDRQAFVVFPEGLRVRVTPTLVLVDRTGAILHAWEAVGPPDRERQIAATLRQTLQ